jgi:hypothetical protein
MTNRHTRLWTWGPITLVLLVCCAAISRSLRRNPEPAVLIALPHSFKTPTRTRDQIESWLPLTPRWAWSHTVIDRLFGKRKPVNVNAETFVFDASFSTETKELGRPSFSTDDGRLSVWFLTTGEIIALRKRLEAAPAGHESYRCRIATADGIAASLFMGESVVLNGQTNPVGVAQSFLPLVNPTGTDLFTSACISAVLTNDSPAGQRIVIQTNTEFAARIQVPAQRGIFFLQRDPPAQSGKSTGLMLDTL